MTTLITHGNVIEIKKIAFAYYNLYSRDVLFNAKVIKACSSQPSRHSVKQTQHRDEINRYLT